MRLIVALRPLARFRLRLLPLLPRASLLPLLLLFLAVFFCLFFIFFFFCSGVALIFLARLVQIVQVLAEAQQLRLVLLQVLHKLCASHRLSKPSTNHVARSRTLTLAFCPLPAD